ITAAGSGCSAAIDAERWLTDAEEPQPNTSQMIGAQP
ncbi:MAG TPA: thioredoxin-disulfide reductase, partial [Mycobacterium sp.]|nr:thioredoxin-disulfide reductase [Mycobacterium sp.]